MKYYSGIDLGGTKIYSIVINENGEILSRNKQKVGDNKDVNKILEIINDSYKLSIESAGLKEDDIIAIGMAVPSAVNIEKGLLLNAPNLGWKNIEMAELLSKITHKKVFIDNDVNLGTYGEYCNGMEKKYNHLYGIFAGTGIGGGYIQNGEIIRGAGSTAGEIGHIIVKFKGPKCNCGNKGCLEAIAGKVGIMKYIQKKVDKEGKTTALEIISPNWRNAIGSSALRKAIEANDALVKKAIKRSAQFIGIAIANIINSIGVEAIILGGGLIEELGDIYMPIIESNMKKYSIAGGALPVKLIQSTLGDDAVAFGAAMIVTKKETEKYLIISKEVLQ